MPVPGKYRSGCLESSTRWNTGQVSILWSSFFLSFMCFANYILGILSFWANKNLSVSAYHVSSFVIGFSQKIQLIADAGEDVEKEEHSSISANLYNHSGNQCGSSSDNWA